MRTSFNLSGYIQNELELSEKVDKIFAMADFNKDGRKLSFTEFKEAFAKNLIFLNNFWTDPKYLQLFQISNNYYNSFSSNKNFMTNRNPYFNKYF